MNCKNCDSIKRCHSYTLSVIAFLLSITPNLFSQDFWNRANGLPLASSTLIAFNQSGHIFVAGGEVFRSTDKGQTWSIASKGLNFNVQTLAINPQGHIFAGSRWNGVYRSTNNGESWEAVNNGLTQVISDPNGNSATVLAINPRGYIFAFFERGGIFRSIDNGNTWSFKGLNWDVQTLKVDVNGNIFAAGLGGLFYTSDNGESWTEIDFPYLTRLHSIALDRDNDLIYVGDESGLVFRSPDKGNTWKIIRIAASNQKIIALAINKNGTIFAGGGTEGVLVSKDRGEHWAKLNKGLKYNYILSLVLNSGGELFATGYGAYRFNGIDSSWVLLNSDLTNPVVTTLAVNKSDHIFAGTWGEGGIFRSTDSGKTWRQVNSGLTFPDVTDTTVLRLPLINSLISNSKGNLFAATTYGIFSFSNNDNLWTLLNKNYTNTYFRTIGVTSQDVLFAGLQGAGIFRSDDGRIWTSKNSGLDNLYVRAIAVNLNDHIWAGTYGGGVYHSTDLGESWKQTNNGLSGLYVNCIAISPKSNHIFLGTDGNGVFRSIDNGQSWAPVNNGITYPCIRSIAINNDGHIYSGTFPCLPNQPYEGGVYVSRDNGGSWTKINSGLMHPFIHALVFTHTDHLFAGTNNGIFMSSKSTTSVKDLGGVSLSLYMIDQNYPNPFNPETIIQFTLPKPNYVSLKVFNVQGEEIATLLSEHLIAGRHKVQWNAAKVANGLYIYQIQAGIWKQSKKMLLIK